MTYRIEAVKDIITGEKLNGGYKKADGYYGSYVITSNSGYAIVDEHNYVISVYTTRKAAEQGIVNLERTKSLRASKLFKASSRKSQINAALLSPSNLALITQLADELDEEYQTAELTGIEDEVEEDESQDAGSDNEADDSDDMDGLVVDEDIDPENDLVTVADLTSTAGSDKSESSNSKEDKPKADTSELIPDSPATDTSAEASTDTDSDSAESIVASTAIIPHLDLQVLKSTLNCREDLAGVARIAEKDNEVWIYYKDDVNLNNVMTDVIEFLINEQYTMLEFNRLARTDNAIVFECLNQVSDLTKAEKMEESSGK